MLRTAALAMLALLVGCTAVPDGPAIEPQVMVIGAVDDPSALDVFLRGKLDPSASGATPTVVARTVEGGAAHPRMTVVYMSAPGWCGSGGCTLFVLVPGPEGLTQIGRVTLAHPPVLALDTQSHGMPELMVRVRADYGPDGEPFAILPFDGQTYAGNPTVPPARWSRTSPDGEIAIEERDVALARGQ